MKNRLDYKDPILLSKIKSMYNDKISPTKIKEVLGLSKKQVLKLHKILELDYSRNRYNYNDLFLSNIASNEEAWVFGWILSDGCLYKDRLKIALHDKDLEVLVKIRDHFQYKGNIYLSKDKATLSISSKILASNLRNLGCHSRKSVDMLYPDVIDDIYLRHFIRGYFEGDGCVTLNRKRKCLSIKIRGTFEFLSGIRNKLYNCLGMWGSLLKYKNSDKNVYSLEFNGNVQCQSFLTWIYDRIDNSIILDRKINRSIELKDYLNSILKNKIEDFC